ncbi:MAG: hypothetical protein ABIK28_00635 [Planctomycetota bacterium]
MIKGSLFPWIALACVAMFFAGFFANKLFENATRTTGEAPTYLEDLTRNLRLSDEQQQKIRRLFEEEDLKCQQVLQNEHSKAIRQSIQEIRSEVEGEIFKVLTLDQQETFKKLAPQIHPPIQGE